MDELNKMFEDFNKIFGQGNLFNVNWTGMPNFNQNNVNIERGSDENGEWQKHTYTSPDGKSTYTSFTRVSSPYFNAINKSELPALEAQLTEAIAKEDYETAITLRDTIANLKQHEDKLKALEADKKAAIEARDFEKAIKIRDEINALKSSNTPKETKTKKK